MLFKRPAVVQVRVLVTESTNANGLRMLAVQEEIIEVSNDQVEQIDVKEIILEFSNNVQEKKRSVSIIKLTKSKIHRLERKHDKHLWACKGLAWFKLQFYLILCHSNLPYHLYPLSTFL